MKYILIYIFLFLNTFAYTGAPAPNNVLIDPPYTFKNGILISIAVKWDKKSIIKYLPSKYKQKEAINGGINIYLTKSELPISKLNYTYAWIELEEGNKEIFLGIFGPNESNKRLIENISQINGNIGKNRVMRINDKVSTRTSIKKDMVLTTNMIASKECKKQKKHSITFNKTNTKTSFSVSNNSDKVCIASQVELAFHGEYKNVKVERVFSGKVFENTEIIFDNKV